MKRIHAIYCPNRSWGKGSMRSEQICRAFGAPRPRQEGGDMVLEGLTPGDELDNDQLCAKFMCSPQGGMRYSKRTESLVLVSNHVKSLYDDRWIGNVLHYTGMGTIGDQSLEFMQNKTLYLSNENGVAVYLFEVFQEKRYTYTVRVHLSAQAYQEIQEDVEGRER